MQLLRCDVVLYAEGRRDVLQPLSAVKAIPEGRSRFVQDIDTVCFCKGPADGNENTFSRYIALYIIRMSGIDGGGVHGAGE